MKKKLYFQTDINLIGVDSLSFINHELIINDNHEVLCHLDILTKIDQKAHTNRHATSFKK